MSTIDLDQELDVLRRDGLVVLPDLLTTEQVATLNGAVDRILEEEGRPDALNMFQGAFRSPEILALLEHERVLDLMVNLLGYNLQLQSSVVSVRRPQPVSVHDIDAFGGRKLPKAGATAASSPARRWSDAVAGMQRV